MMIMDSGLLFCATL